MRRVIAMAEKISKAPFREELPKEVRTRDALQTLLRKILLIRLFSDSSAVLSRRHKTRTRKKSPVWGETPLTLKQWGNVYELAFAELLTLIEKDRSFPSEERRAQVFCSVFEGLEESRKFLWPDFLKRMPTIQSSKTRFTRTRELCRKNGYVRAIQWLVPTAFELCSASSEIDPTGPLSLSEQHEPKIVSTKFRGHPGYPFYFEIPFDRRHVLLRQRISKKKKEGRGQITKEARAISSFPVVRGPSVCELLDWLYDP